MELILPPPSSGNKNLILFSGVLLTLAVLASMVVINSDQTINKEAESNSGGSVGNNFTHYDFNSDNITTNFESTFSEFIHPYVIAGGHVVSDTPGGEEVPGHGSIQTEFPLEDISDALSGFLTTPLIEMDYRDRLEVLEDFSKVFTVNNIHTFPLENHIDRSDIIIHSTDGPSTIFDKPLTENPDLPFYESLEQALVGSIESTLAERDYTATVYVHHELTQPATINGQEVMTLPIEVHFPNGIPDDINTGNPEDANFNNWPLERVIANMHWLLSLSGYGIVPHPIFTDPE